MKRKLCSRIKSDGFAQQNVYQTEEEENIGFQKKNTKSNGIFDIVAVFFY